MQPLQTFDELKHGDKIISPIDCEVTEYYVNKDGDKYLASKKSLFALHQFEAEDFYRYAGAKDVGEKDEEYIGEIVREIKEER